MNEQDKPLGAPNLEEASPKSESPEQPAKKRKLNWKGFFIAIIAVVFIEWAAITSLNSGDPQLPPPPTEPTAKPTQSVVQAQIVTLVSVVNRGGLCPVGDPCTNERTVDSTGSVKQDKKEVKKITVDQVKELQTLINETDFAAIKNKPFTGTCPIAFDGQETVYTFQTPKGNEVLEGCKYDIDTKLPLFTFIERTIQQ